MMLRSMRPLYALAVIAAMFSVRLCLAADVPTTAPPASEAAKDAAAAPALPPYFSGANAEGAKPTWPDPTGSASGIWATPAGDGKGDITSKQTNTDLYDRIAHNLYSINMV